MYLSICMYVKIQLKSLNNRISLRDGSIFLTGAHNSTEECLEELKWSITYSAGTIRKILTTKAHSIIPLLKIFSGDLCYCCKSAMVSYYWKIKQQLNNSSHPIARNSPVFKDLCMQLILCSRSSLASDHRTFQNA